ncbi:acylpyruvate hydrolase [Paraburkholderia sp. GAS199]|uniref:fumarylacetoacetate hydrolase family protein n=1 Tax=Paraburkholderia sp. GAS199 TaxID=3035126 RepID=UPI003D223A26
MRFFRYQTSEADGIALLEKDIAYGLQSNQDGYPGNIYDILRRGGDALEQAAEVLRSGTKLNLGDIKYLPLVGESGKVLCVGINYKQHVEETGNKIPVNPTLFTRVFTSLIGHSASIVRPKASVQLDYEGELMVIIGKTARHVSKDDALQYVAGYTIFNDGSIRDFQFESPQWTVGKNFDATGAIGPVLVTADELPPGGAGLRLQTRLNGKVLQEALTSEMIYDVATTIAFLSKGITLEPGDAIAMGTPPGVGVAREPQMFMKAGDVCEIEIERIGILINSVVDEK